MKRAVEMCVLTQIPIPNIAGRVTEFVVTAHTARMGLVSQPVPIARLVTPRLTRVFQHAALVKHVKMAPVWIHVVNACIVRMGFVSKPVTIAKHARMVPVWTNVVNVPTARMVFACPVQIQKCVAAVNVLTRVNITVVYRVPEAYRAPMASFAVRARVANQAGNVVEVNVCRMIAHIVLIASHVPKVRCVVSGRRDRYMAVMI